MATPGNMPAPYHWRTSLPWLADILSGLVYYFAGMLTAQRDVRWYGSRGLALAAAFFCSYLVWALPEFWQALAGDRDHRVCWWAWRRGAASAPAARTPPQPRLAKAALAMTFLAGSADRERARQANDRGVVRFRDLMGVQTSTARGV